MPWGSVTKKSELVPDKAGPQAQQAFLEVYQELKYNKGKMDPIYFMDGVHPQHNTLASYGWIRRGAEKAIKSNSGRKRLDINGANQLERLSYATNAVCYPLVNRNELGTQIPRDYLQDMAGYLQCSYWLISVGPHILNLIVALTHIAGRLGHSTQSSYVVNPLNSG